MRIPFLRRLFSANDVPTPRRVAQEIRPVIGRDFPDPKVIAADGGYYAYSTNSFYAGRLVNVPVWRAEALGGPWTALGDALPELPGWVADAGHGGPQVWAPEVVPASEHGYLLYFTARHARDQVQCLGVAASPYPGGPFRPVRGDALVVRPEDGDTLDAATFIDAGAQRHLVYKSGRFYSTVWLRELSADGLRVVGDRKELIRSDRPEEANIVEAPTLVRRDLGTGTKYVLLYSANTFNSGRYFVNYATADRLDGPFSKAPGALLTSDTIGGAYRNTGHQDVVAGPDGDYLFFHARLDGRQRGVFAAGLDWSADGSPVVKVDRQPAPARTSQTTRA